MFKLKRIALVKLPDRVHPDCEENNQITEMGINKKSLRLGGGGKKQLHSLNLGNNFTNVELN